MSLVLSFVFDSSIVARKSSFLVSAGGGGGAENLPTGATATSRVLAGMKNPVILVAMLQLSARHGDRGHVSNFPSTGDFFFLILRQLEINLMTLILKHAYVIRETRGPGLCRSNHTFTLSFSGFKLSCFAS